MMLNLSGFSQDSLDKARWLFQEGHTPDEGKCNQKRLREQRRNQMSPEQRQAAQERGQNQRGRDNVPSATRSEAAKRAAETRKRCKGAGGGTTSGPATL